MIKHALPRFTVILAGSALPFAFAPYDFYILAIICPLILFSLCHQQTSKEAFLRGYLFALFYFGIGVNWLHISINLFGGVNLIGALIFTYLLVAFISLYPALSVFLAIRYFSRHSIIAMPLLWILLEWLRGWFLSGFPWLNIGTSQTDSLFRAYMPVIGDYGTGFIIVSLAASFVIIFRYSSNIRWSALFYISLIITLASYLLPQQWSTPLNRSLSVTLVQGAIPQEVKWKPEMRKHTLDSYLSLSEVGWQSDLLIWPETAIPLFYQVANEYLTSIREKQTNSNTLFMSGIAFQDTTTRQYFNSILIQDEEDRFYHKSQLVPFGEYLPFKPLLGGILKILEIPMSDFSKGDPSAKTIITDKATLGMSICYEDAYSEIFRQAMPDANIFINISNDAWFGDSLAPHQHLQIAKVRTIEYQRSLLRATNTGISAIIDYNSNIVLRSPQFIPYALSGSVELYEGNTPFSRFGNIPMLIICSVLLLLLLRLNNKV